jgi:hypothetical protein
MMPIVPSATNKTSRTQMIENQDQYRFYRPKFAVTTIAGRHHGIPDWYVHFGVNQTCGG